MAGLPPGGGRKKRCRGSGRGRARRPRRSPPAGPRRDKDAEGRARHAEAEAVRARRRSRSYSPIRKRRRDSPSFMEPRRITRYGGAGGPAAEISGVRAPGTSWSREGTRRKERRWGFTEGKGLELVLEKGWDSETEREVPGGEGGLKTGMVSGGGLKAHGEEGKRQTWT